MKKSATMTLIFALMAAPVAAEHNDEAQNMMNAARAADSVEYQATENAVIAMMFQDELKTKFWGWEISCPDLITNNRMGKALKKLAHNRFTQYQEQEEMLDLINTAKAACGDPPQMTVSVP